MRRLQIIFLGLVFGLITTLPAVAASPDSLTLSYADFLGLVLENHPLARQARLTGRSGASYLRAARGAFDPYLASNWDSKQFDGKNYWQVFQGSLRVPTWFGAELYTGFATATGDYLDNSQYLPNGGQATLGIEVNLGRGLLMDQRRAELRKAQAYAQSTLVQQRLLLLDLVQDATAAYWQWWVAAANNATFKEALQLADTRFRGVRASYLRGEMPAIDTLESYLQVQNRILNVNETEVELVKRSRALNNFLWNMEGQPVEFQAALRPQAMGPTDPAVLQLPPQALDSLLFSHPDLAYYELKATQLTIEERWRKEQLKPELTIKYQALTAKPAQDALLGSLMPGYNNKWGVKFSFPLLVRKQRGYLELVRLDQEAVEWQAVAKRQELENKIAAMLQQLQATAAQITLYETIVDNYAKLVKAEMDRFQLGESSIFLINSREQKLIEAELKLNELRGKLPQLLGDANRATGGYWLGWGAETE